MTPLPYAHGGPPLQARLRSRPEDFVVEELQDLQPDGQGEHLWLRLRKRGLTTEALARALARHFGVKPLDVGYAGLKDRHALTTQVFTVYRPERGDTPAAAPFQLEGVEVLQQTRHGRKLKRGALRGNAFVLTLRELRGDRAAAEQRLQALAAAGAPNYFGDQRFGYGGGNVARAEAMFAGQRVDRDTRSLLLSAARSQLFNAVLAERVRQGCWNTALEGELWSLAGSRAWFGPEPWSAALEARLVEGDIHPSGPLWGRGALPTQGEALALETRVLQPYASLRAGLEAAGLTQDRRALRLRPRGLDWAWADDDVLVLRFALPPGAYATVIVRELCGDPPAAGGPAPATRAAQA
jgi:tRNA pseudouridine13 synthase